MGTEASKAVPWTENWLTQWLALFGLFGVAFALWQFAPMPPQAPAWLSSHHYLAMAQEIAQGHGFTIVAPPSLAESVGQTAPLYPLLLAALMQIMGQPTWPEALPAIMSVQLALYGMAIVLVFLFVRTRLKGHRALLLATWFALWPAIWGAAKVPGPAMLAIVCVLMALWMTDKYFSKTGSDIKPGQVLHCCFWVVACVLALPAYGLPLMVSFLVITFIKLGTKRGTNAVLGMAVVLLPWCLWFMSRHGGGMDAAVRFLLPMDSVGAVNQGVLHRPIDLALDWLAAHAAQGLWGSFAIDQIPLVGPWIAPQFQVAMWSWGAVGVVRWATLLMVVFGALVGFNQFSGVASGFLMLMAALAIVFGQLDALAQPVMLPLVGLALLTGLHWLAIGLKEVQLKPVGVGLINLATALVVLQTLTLISPTSSWSSALAQMPSESGVSSSLPAPEALPNAFYQGESGFEGPQEKVLASLGGSLASLETMVDWRRRSANQQGLWFSNAPDLLQLYADVPVVRPLPAMDANLRAGVAVLGRYYCWFSPQEKAGYTAGQVPVADVLLPDGVPVGATLLLQNNGIRVWGW